MRDIRERRGGGVTLVELLVALAVSGLIVLVLLGQLRSSARAHDVGSGASDVTQALSLAAGLLREELSRAGEAPWPNATEVWPLELDLSAGAHRLRVRYLDDRLVGGLTERDITLSVGLDARGQYQLYRSSAGGPRQPLVAGVERLEVVGGVSYEGANVPPHELSAVRLRALLLQLSVAEGLLEVVAPLPNAPVVSVP